MNTYDLQNIKNTDKLLQDNFLFDKDKFSVFLNNVYKIGKSDNYEILLSWKDKDNFSMLSIYSIYMVYSFMYDKNFLFSDFDLPKAIKRIYEDMIKEKDLVTLKAIKENYILKVLKKVILNNSKQKKEATDMSLNKYLQNKLNISTKESQLIEMIAKEYSRKKKMKELDMADVKKGVSKLASKVKKMFYGNKYFTFIYEAYTKFTSEFSTLKAESDSYTFKFNLKDVITKHSDEFSTNVKDLETGNVDNSTLIKDFLNIVPEKIYAYEENVNPRIEVKNGKYILILEVRGLAFENFLASRWDELFEKSSLSKEENAEKVYIEKIMKKVNPYNYIFKKIDEELTDRLEKKEESLKSYLQKRLMINSKEAELIESVAKEYSRKKKMKELDWKKGAEKVKSFFGKGKEPIKDIKNQKDNVSNYNASYNKMYKDFNKAWDDYGAESGTASFAHKRAGERSFPEKAIDFTFGTEKGEFGIPLNKLATELLFSSSLDIFKKSILNKYNITLTEENFQDLVFDVSEMKQLMKTKPYTLHKEKSLKSYLQKRLTLNSKEAEFIESVVKKYVSLKKNK